MIDASGNVATFTGAHDIQAAGGVAGGGNAGKQIACGTAGGMLSTGKDFSAQANLMANDKVWPAMAKAYAESTGDLADHLLAALDAAQSVGGDIRGKQSAALIVVSGKSSGKRWQDEVFNLRVDDNPAPLIELRRLVALQRAYNGAKLNLTEAAGKMPDADYAYRPSPDIRLAGPLSTISHRDIPSARGASACSHRSDSEAFH